MASISVEKRTGLKRLLFFVGDKRITIHMGPAYKVVDRSKGWQRSDKKVNTIFCGHIEAMIKAQAEQEPLPADTAAWLAKLDKVLLDKLAALGLTQERKKTPVALDAFIADYLSKRTDLKPRSINCLEQTQIKLSKFFGADRNMAAIRPAEIEDFRRYLEKEGLEESTISRSMGRAMQFFRRAVRDEIIMKNPFDRAELPHRCVRGNDAKFHFVSREETQKLIDACPNAQWRLLIALARYGGMRCPSEPLVLTWADILWDQRKVLIHSPKTERHAGHESRWIPLYDELEPYLQAAYDKAKPGEKWVITHYRAKYTGLGTPLKKIALEAGLTLWPLPWNAMRKSRECELIESGVPEHVVAKLIGHTQQVARTHYLLDVNSYIDNWRSKYPSQKPSQSESECVRLDSNASDDEKSENAAMSDSVRCGRDYGYPDKTYLENSRRFSSLAIASSFLLR